MAFNFYQNGDPSASSMAAMASSPSGNSALHLQNQLQEFVATDDDMIVKPGFIFKSSGRCFYDALILKYHRQYQGASTPEQKSSIVQAVADAYHYNDRSSKLHQNLPWRDSRQRLRRFLKPKSGDTTLHVELGDEEISKKIVSTSSIQHSFENLHRIKSAMYDGARPRCPNISFLANDLTDSYVCFYWKKSEFSLSEKRIENETLSWQRNNITETKTKAKNSLGAVCPQICNGILAWEATVPTTRGLSASWASPLSAEIDEPTQQRLPAWASLSGSGAGTKARAKNFAAVRIHEKKGRSGLLGTEESASSTT